MSAPLLEVRGVSTWFPIRRGILSRVRGHVRAVQEASLVIREGETVGLVGESGCGKTTLGRTILGLEKAAAGDILFRGQSVLAASRDRAKELRRSIQMIFQDPQASLNPRLTVLDLLTEGMVEHGLLQGDEESAAAALLRDVGMEASAMYRYPFEFSGGQRQRISVARALSLRPALIVCDEAVSALDVSVQAQVINLLLDLKDKYRLSYLFISHDLSVVRFISQRVAVMYLGRIVEEGPVDQVMSEPLHPYTQALLSAAPRPGAERGPRIVLAGEAPSPSRPPPGCPFHPRCRQRLPACDRVYPRQIDRDGHIVDCHLYSTDL